MINSCIYSGSVIHKRFKPKEHFFKYKVFSLFLDLSELNELDDKLNFFSLNKYNNNQACTIFYYFFEISFHILFDLMNFEH